MRDVDRAAITEMVYRKLAEPSFRNRLTARAPDGSRPVHVALREDPVRTVVDQLVSAGGASNVVVPVLNGFVVLAMQSEDPPPGSNAVSLRDDCTVGVFIERLKLDVMAGEHAMYGFVVKGPGRRQGAGRAEVVALAG